MRSIIQHLRFPFSYLLLPVFLFTLISVDLESTNLLNVWILFIILHFLVYPSSNAYNSLQDNDSGSIGLIENPLPADKNIGIVSLSMDILAILLSLIISWQTAVYIAIYILASRLYSYRKVRLKQYPILGFLIVFFFQGAFTYFLVIDSLEGFVFNLWMNATPFHAVVASCLIGSIYPLSQIYQHKEDRADGVTTISYLLGKKGTFIFSGLFFLIGLILFAYPIWENPNERILVYLFILFQLPSLIYFNFWFYRVIQDESQANFKHTMRMNLISATCMNAFFITLIFF
jgi:1,4-dihydroxy-2-naphthoate octaprenyltransferase